MRDILLYKELQNSLEGFRGSGSKQYRENRDETEVRASNRVFVSTIRNSRVFAYPQGIFLSCRLLLLRYSWTPGCKQIRFASGCKLRSIASTSLMVRQPSNLIDTLWTFHLTLCQSITSILIFFLSSQYANLIYFLPEFLPFYYLLYLHSLQSIL